MSGSPDGLPPLREVIAEHGLAAKKALGQNFLLDLNLTRRIARAAGPLEGVEVLVLDALREKPHSTHFSIDEAVAVAQKIGARQTYFVHMTHDVDHATANDALPDGIELAYDGLQIDV